jgi:hypothetical protein
VERSRTTRGAVDWRIGLVLRRLTVVSPLRPGGLRVTRRVRRCSVTRRAVRSRLPCRCVVVLHAGPQPTRAKERALYKAQWSALKTGLAHGASGHYGEAIEKADICPVFLP